jgi:hypothetical protein
MFCKQCKGKVMQLSDNGLCAYCFDDLERKPVDTAELFLNACRLYKVWCDTGKDAVNCWPDYEAWDVAVIAFAEAIKMSRSHATLYVFDAVRVQS